MWVLIHDTYKTIYSGPAAEVDWCPLRQMNRDINSNGTCGECVACLYDGARRLGWNPIWVNDSLGLGDATYGSCDLVIAQSILQRFSPSAIRSILRDWLYLPSRELFCRPLTRDPMPREWSVTFARLSLYDARIAAWVVYNWHRAENGYIRDFGTCLTEQEFNRLPADRQHWVRGQYDFDMVGRTWYRRLVGEQISGAGTLHSGDVQRMTFPRRQWVARNFMLCPDGYWRRARDQANTPELERLNALQGAN